MAQEVIQATLEVSTNSIKALREEIKQYKAEVEKAEIGTEALQEASDKLTKAQQQLKNALTLGTKEIDAADDSYNALVRKMSELRDVWKQTNDEAERNKIGQEIAGINTRLKDMDASIGNFQRNVGDYQGKIVAASRKASETLTNALAPALRENVTLTFDAIESWRAYSEILDNSGQNIDDVAKGVGSLKFGLAALIAGVYAIYNYFSEWNEELNATARELSAVERASLEFEQSVNKELVTLSTLYSITQDGNAEFEKRLSIAGELKREYPEYLGQLSEEEILAGKAATAYSELAGEIEKVARSKAALEQLTALEMLALSNEAEVARREYEAMVNFSGEKMITVTQKGGSISFLTGMASRDPLQYNYDVAGGEKAKVVPTDEWIKAQARAEDAIVKLSLSVGQTFNSYEDFVAYLESERKRFSQYVQPTSTTAPTSTSTSNTPNNNGGGSNAFDVQGYLGLLTQKQREREADTYSEEMTLLDERFRAQVDDDVRKLEQAGATEEQLMQLRLYWEEEYLIQRAELWKKYNGEDVAPEKALFEQQKHFTDEEIKLTVKKADVDQQATEKQLKNIKRKERVQKAAALAESKTFEASQNLMQAGQALFEENTIAYKAFAVAEAVMNTYMAVTAALASGGGMPWAAIQVAATIATGMAAVMKILKTPTDGSMSSVSTGEGNAIVSAPAVVQEVPVTRTLTGVAEEAEQQANSEQRVVLVYSDVEAAGRRVKVRQTESSF